MQLESIVARQLANLSFRQVSPEVSRQNLVLNELSQQSSSSRYSTAINPEKITQIIHSWNLKFDGSAQGVATLTKDCLNNDIDSVCKNLHILLVGKAREWYWRYRKENPQINWREFGAALKEQYTDYRNDTDILEEIRARKQKQGETFEVFYDDVMLLASRMSTSIPEQQLIEMLTRNLLPEIRHELLCMQIRSIAHLRKLVQMRENLLGEVATRRLPKPAPNPVFSRRNVAALEDDNGIQDTDPNLAMSTQFKHR